VNAVAVSTTLPPASSAIIGGRPLVRMAAGSVMVTSDASMRAGDTRSSDSR